MNVEIGMPHPGSSPGDARHPAESTQDIIAADRNRAPAWAASESYMFLGDADVSKDRYTDPAFAKGEFEKMWTRTWQNASWP